MRRIPAKQGCCAKCAWHLRREEWCLPKGIVISHPDDVRPCGLYQPKGDDFVPAKKERKRK